MKKALIIIFTAALLLSGLGTQVHAAEALPIPPPAQTIIEIKDDRHYAVKTHERTLDTDEADPSALKEEPFALDGYLYTFFGLKKEAIPVVERRQAAETVTLETETDDAAVILQQLAAELPYEEDGFEGVLALNHTSIRTAVKAYEARNFTLTDTQTFNGLPDTDPVVIPKTIVKSGVTLKLMDVSWSVQETMVVGYDTVPSKYSATAQYSGSYSKNVPVGYVTTAQYTGEIVKSRIDKIVYTVMYLGEEIVPEAPSEPPIPNLGGNLLESEVAKPVKLASTPQGWIAALVCLLLAGGGAGVYFLRRRNVAIFAKDGDDLKLITRRYVKWETPTIDLRRVPIPTTEAAICVRQSLANRLFGRQIPVLVTDDYTVKCFVDTQNADFWAEIDLTEIKPTTKSIITREELK